MTKIAIVVGNRPQFIKLSPLEKEFKKRNIDITLIHTGQHYDFEMDESFFQEFGIKMPDHRLTIRGKTHGSMTGQMLEAIETIFIQQGLPKSVMVIGDTNTTLAAALASSKLDLPISHIESGPRFKNAYTPEEINRTLTDHMSSYLFAPDLVSLENLRKEGLGDKSYFFGDVMYDQFLITDAANKFGKFQNRSDYIFMTIHRPPNVDSIESHRELLTFIKKSRESFVFSLHPRTKCAIEKFELMEEYNSIENLSLLGPLSYSETIKAIKNSKFIITDSGGVQKEAFFAKKLAFLLLPNTPWPLIRQAGLQFVSDWLHSGRLENDILRFGEIEKPIDWPVFFGDGNASKYIVDLLVDKDLA